VSRGSYADTLLAEVRLAGGLLRGLVPPLRTVFFGGGTPTLLPAEHLALVLRELRDTFGFAPDVEVTTEANPDTVTPAYLAALRRAGFTRISLGMQSAVPSVLAVLDRTHGARRPERAVAEARAAGFAHVNLDLIYGTPGETDADWQASLDAAIAAGPDHISAYALVVEEGTALARRVAAGELPPVDDDVLADRYVMADETFSAAGFEWYEVSNWAAAPSARCRHNELYWSDANWWGFGPGAHSHVGGVRWWNVKHPARYAAMLDNGLSPAAGRERLSAEQRHTEKVMLGVRRRDGLPFADLDDRARAGAQQLARWGLVEPAGLADERIVLTQRGRLLADAVVRELLG
jgi:oxygen-independent coproporphyrinogen-3 oxidase